MNFLQIHSEGVFLVLELRSIENSGCEKNPKKIVLMKVREGVKKKSCNIVTTYVGGQTGNYTKFIYFFHGPNSSKSAKKFFLLGG